MNPKHPIYIISKGRWESRLTARSLDLLKTPYSIVVEPQEEAQYRAALASSIAAGLAQVLVLPFSNLGCGSIPARNWVWAYSMLNGERCHWIMDDNIRGFYRVNRNLKTPVGDATMLKCVEDFAARYENVAQAGLHYFMFGYPREIKPPFYLNTRVYSCMLLRNDLYDAPPESSLRRLTLGGTYLAPTETELRAQFARAQLAEPTTPGKFFWRGRYNEDTDLSLRFLKAKYCTLLFNAFLCDKQTTMTMSGGNMESLYKRDEQMDGRRLMAESLAAQHPDVAKVTYKWGRWQHTVNYKQFAAIPLKLKPGVDRAAMPEVDNYGMKLQELVPDYHLVEHWTDCPPGWPARRSYAAHLKEHGPLG